MHNTRAKLFVESDGLAYRIAHEAPLYAHGLPRGTLLRVISTDQSGGMRNGDASDVTVACRGGTLLYTPAAAAVFYAGFHSREGHHEAVRAESEKSAARHEAAHHEVFASRVRQRIEVAGGAFCCFVGAPNIPCAFAHVQQTTSISCAEDADLFFLDAWCAGRIHSHVPAFARASAGNATAHHAEGEQDLFYALRCECTLEAAGKKLYEERWDIMRGMLTEAACASPYAVWYSALAYGEKAKKLLGEIAPLFPGTFERAALCEFCDVLRGVSENPGALLHEMQERIVQRIM